MGVGRRRGEGGTRNASLIVLTFAETSKGYLWVVQKIPQKVAVSKIGNFIDVNFKSLNGFWTNGKNAKTIELLLVGNT